MTRDIRRLTARVAVLASLMSGAAAAVLACSSSSTVSVTPPLAEASTKEPTATNDGAVGNPRGVPVVCAPQSVANLDTILPVPAGRYPGLCTNDQIELVYDDCFKNSYLTTACTNALMKVGSSCATCMSGGFVGGSPAIAHLVNGESFFNTPICVADVEGDAGKDSCAAKLYTVYACQAASCAPSCALNSAEESTAFGKCLTDALTGPCSKYSAAADSCYGDAGSGDGGLGTGTSYCDPAYLTGDNALAHYAFMCGAATAGATDGGSDAGALDAAPDGAM